MYKIIVIALLALVPVCAPAAGYLTNMSQGVLVSTYVVNNSVPSNTARGLTLILAGPISNPDGCAATDKVHIPSTVPNYSILVAGVIAAVSAGQTIGFYSSGCSSIRFWGGTTTYPQIWNI